MKVKIKAELMTGRDLKPGDLFSTASAEYWDGAMDKGSIGECVYIRTNFDATPFHGLDAPIYRITIEVEHE